MSHHLVVLDGIEAQPQVIEFLAGVKDRTPGVRFVVLVPGPTGPSQTGPATAARLACNSLEALRAAGLPVLEALAGEGGQDLLHEELQRPDRSYDCVLRFTPFRRGIHIQRTIPAARRYDALPPQTAPLLAG